MLQKPPCNRGIHSVTDSAQMRPPRRKVLGGGTALAIACGTRGVVPSHAWCGGFFPGKVTNDWDERLVHYVAGDYETDIFVRIINPPRRRVMGSSSREFPKGPLPLPPVLLIGCPGVSYEYLENLEGLVISGRQVIAINTCEAPVDRDWVVAPPSRGPYKERTPRAAAAQVLAACEACRIGSAHVIAHGLGGAVQTRYTRVRQNKRTA